MINSKNTRKIQEIPTHTHTHTHIHTHTHTHFLKVILSLYAAVISCKMLEICHASIRQ